MSEEQINTETETGTFDSETVEVEESGTATDETEQQPEQAEPQEQEPDYQKIIAEKAYEARQAKREREELAKKLEELQANAPREQEPTIPPTPDPWDDDFEAKLKARDEALLKHAEFKAQERIKQQQTEQQEQARLQQQQQQLVEKANAYSERAKSLGVSAEELAQAGQRLAGAVTDQVAEHILADDKGPLLTKYLAANPLDVDRLAGMTPMQAAVYLETQIKPKAEQFGVKKVTQAPEPVDTLSGNGAAPFEGPEGGQFY